jgi:hypothetical protein
MRKHLNRLCWLRGLDKRLSKGMYRGEAVFGIFS